jgi:nicotinate-nucleotide--dimethylbenzimidazole phosphoribosyltransferase
VARSGVSAYPPEVTTQMVGAFLGCHAAVSVLAAQHGATVRVLDLAVDCDADTLPAEVTQFKVRRSSADLSRGPALTRDEAIAAFEAGRAIADQEVDTGADLLIAGDMGIGNTTPAATLVAVLTGAWVQDVVGRGTGIDDTTWARKVAAVRDAAVRGRRVADDPIALMAEVTGADLAATAGFLVQAAVRRTPVLLDGIVSTAVALLAARIAPACVDWFLASHLSTEPAAQAALERLGLRPLLDLGLRLGEGSGALVALPLVRAAGALLAEMSTFEELGVSDRAD